MKIKNLLKLENERMREREYILPVYQRYTSIFLLKAVLERSFLKKESSQKSVIERNLLCCRIVS